MTEPTPDQMEAFNRLIRDRGDQITTSILRGGSPVFPVGPIDFDPPLHETTTFNLAETSKWGDVPDLGVDMLREMSDMLAKAAPPPLPEFRVVPADRQCRTPLDVPAGTRRTSPRPPPKARGRRGTRKAWKRRNPPRTVQVFTYREPVDVLVIVGSARQPFGNYWPEGRDFLAINARYQPPPPDLWIVTPLQKERIDRALREHDETIGTKHL
jgi:hypothetical protein